MKHPTLLSVAKRYIVDGSFILDILATVPPMLTQEKYTSVNFLKYLRLYHFKDLMEPIRLLLALIMRNSNTKKINNAFSFTVLILTTLLLAHFLACTWIFLGNRDQDLEDIAAR